MPVEPPSPGASEPDLEKILAQLLAGATAEEVLETTSVATAVPEPPLPSPGGGTAGGRTDWERYSAVSISTRPLEKTSGASVLNARIELLKAPKAPR